MGAAHDAVVYELYGSVRQVDAVGQTAQHREWRPGEQGVDGSWARRQAGKGNCIINYF